MALKDSKEYSATLHGLASFAIKQYTVIKRDGVEISRTPPLTRAVVPGDDISMYPEEIQGMCDGYWTDDIIAAYEAQQAEIENR